MDIAEPQTPTGPTAPHERIALLDAIRGVALGGILLANLMSFFGSDMLDAQARRAMPFGAWGERVLFAVNWLVEGKFYSVFSMLFGIGFALQAARAAARATVRSGFDRFFRRRMSALVALGLLHMFTLWSGDILMLYGVMGLLLPAFARLHPPVRTVTMVALFLVPLATHGLVLISDGRADPRAPFAAAGAIVREQLGVGGRPALDVFAHGTARDYFAWNTSFAVARPGTYLQSGRPAKVLALFLLGVWWGTAVLPRVEHIRRRLWITAIAGGLIGLPASYLYALIKADTGSTFLVSSLGVIQTTAYTLGTTPLAVAYMAMAALAWPVEVFRLGLAWFVPLGRMALTVYLSQTLIQLLLFSGVGLGLAGRVPLVALPLVAVLMLVTQRYACVWWLHRHSRGPVEWMWRRATYGRL